MKFNPSAPLAYTLRLLCSTIAFLLLAYSADARPTKTKDTGTLPRGAWEIESGVDYEEENDETEFGIETSFALGLTPHMETEVGWEYVFEDSEDGRETESLVTEIELKAFLWQATDESFSMGISGDVAFPSSVSGTLGSTDPEGLVRLLFTKPAGAAQYDFNLGYDYRGAWGTGNDESYFLSVGARYKASSRLQLLSEVFAEIPTEETDEAIGVVAAGCKYAVSKTLKLDFLVGTGVGHDSPDLRATFGGTWKL